MHQIEFISYAMMVNLRDYEFDYRLYEGHKNLKLSDILNLTKLLFLLF